MKYLMVVLTLMSTTVFAQEVPSYLKDGVITVTLKNGKTYTYSANEYMVVRRDQAKVKVEAAVAETKAEMSKANEQAVKEAGERKRNIISLEGVSGQRGLRSKFGSSYAEVETKREYGLGIQYQRLIYREVIKNGDLYLGGRIDTNESFGVNLGLGF